VAVYEIGHQGRQAIIVTLQPVVFDRHILAFDKACFVEALSKRGRVTHVGIGRPISDKSDQRHRCLLRPQREWPRDRRARPRIVAFRF